MSPLLAAAIILAFIAVGEILSIWSKARVPSLLVAMLGAFIFAKIGLIPENLVTTSTMVIVGTLIQPPIMVHMGSLIPLSTMKAQWKAVLIALGGMLVGVGMVLAIVTPLFGFEYSVAGAGPLAGGIISTSLTTQGLTEAGIATAVIVVPSLVLMLQSLPSMPLTNYLLRSYSLKLRDTGDLKRLGATGPSSSASSAHNDGAAGTTVATRPKLVRLPEKLAENQLFLLFLVFTAGAAALHLGELTGISYSIWGLLLGIILTALGVIPDRVLERSNSFGIAMAAIICIVVAPLMTASLDDVIASLLPVLAILGFGMIGILIGGFIVTKLLGWHPKLGMSVALTAMYGFPADYLIVQEVVRSTARDEEESTALRDHLLPPMLIGGFTSVSAGSIIVASVLVGML